MILQIENIEVAEPRISLNQLGEFPFVSDKKKQDILYSQKFPNGIRAPYYTRALSGILRSFQDGIFLANQLSQEAAAIEALPDETHFKAARNSNNAEAIRRFAAIGVDAYPPEGIHKIVRQNAKLNLDGVLISARPEIITENMRSGDFAFTKLRFSKSPVSADAQEIVLLSLIHYGQRQSHDELVFSIEKTKLIDCFSRTVTLGHTIRRHRDQQLHQALAEIREMWPFIAKRESGE
jgi:hypothetical protein